MTPLVMHFLLNVFFNVMAFAQPVRLDDAYQSALERTETIPIQQSLVRQSEALVQQARGSFLPTLAAKADYTRQDSDSEPEATSSRLNLTQPLFSGGKNYATYKASKYTQSSAEFQLADAKLKTFAEVANSFYSVLSSEQEVLNIKKTLSLTHDRIREIKKRTNIGRSRNIDVLAAEAQLSVLNAELTAAQGQLVVARDQFSLLTGLQNNAELIEKSEAYRSLKDLNTYLAFVEKRPDVESLRVAVDAGQSLVSAARAGHMPTLSLTGNYYFSRPDSLKHNDWDAGVTLSLPLFSGGIVDGEVKEASAKKTESELLLKQKRRQAETDIKVAYNNLQSALLQLKSLQEALVITEKNYREQERNYRFSQSTNLDVIQALNTFQDTKKTFDRTRFLAMSAWAELKAATAQVP